MHPGCVVPWVWGLDLPSPLQPHHPTPLRWTMTGLRHPSPKQFRAITLGIPAPQSCTGPPRPVVFPQHLDYEACAQNLSYSALRNFQAILRRPVQRGRSLLCYEQSMSYEALGKLYHQNLSFLISKMGQNSSASRACSEVQRRSSGREAWFSLQTFSWL